jgi:serine/threonine protein kinase
MLLRCELRMSTASLDETVVSREGPPRQAAALPWARKSRPCIGKYEIARLLGRGGMGAVYQAFDPVLERDVALKVMLPEAAADREHKERFEREARAVARLSHPAIVTLYDLGYHTDGSPYIVMELLKGRDLLARLRDPEPLPLVEKLGIVAQVLDGLAHAHKAGIVHRDVKPANIFLTEEGAARLMDFGVAFWTSGGATSSNVVGTIAYMSPEQVHGRAVDGRSDLFSVGTLLHEMLTGARPFDGDSPMATFHRISRGDSALALGPEHEGLRPVLARALALAPDDRFATAAEFAAELRARIGRTTEAGPILAPAPPATPPQPAPVTAAPRSDPSRLFALLREIHVERKSGHLHLTVSGGRKSLRVSRGQIVNGTSDTPGEHMGDVLVRFGLVRQVDLDRAVAVVLRDRKRLGAVLREQGLLAPDRITEAVGLHAREILFGAISRPGLTCTFEELSESLLDSDLACPFSTGQLILEATRRILDPELVRTVLGDTGRALALGSDPQLSQSLALTPQDGFVLSRVDGRSSARDVIALVPLPAEEAERSLFSLLCTGVIGYVQPRRAPAPPRAGATPTPRPAPSPRTDPPEPPPAAPGPAAASLPAAPGPDDLRAFVLDRHARPRCTHFEVLGLERGANAAAVRDAYYRLAKALHPDSCRDGSLDDVRGERDAVFARLSAAYQVLRDPLTRAEYEGTLPAPKTAPASPPRPAPATARAAASASPLHPAAPPRTSAPVQPTEVDARLQPEHVVQAAARDFEEGRYWEAIQQLEPVVVRATGRARRDARLLLARAYLRNPRWNRRAEAVLRSILDDDACDVEAALLLAGIYREAKLPARARSVYRAVLASVPGQPEAARQLAALQAGLGPDGS